jgi:putative transposase
MPRKAYPSDLTNTQWARLAPLLPPPRPGGRPRTVDLREVVNGVLYRGREGCTWRALPHDLPPWQTAYDYFRQWRLDGTWEGVNAALRERVRAKAGREPTPSAAILDSQSAKTTERGGRAATTPPRRSPGASATSSSTPAAWSSRPASTRPTSRTPRGRSRC